MKKTLIILCLIFWVTAMGSPVNAAIAYVQSDSAYGPTNITLNGVAAGNLLVAFVNGGGSSAGTTISDDQSNSWTALTMYGPGNDTPSYPRIYYAYNVNSGNTVITMNNPPIDDGFSVHEYSGIESGSDPFDQESGAGSTGTTFSSGNVTTTQADELLVGFWANENANVFTSATGWIQRTSQTGHVHYTFDKIVSSTGTYDFSGTQTSNNSTVAVIATFKATVAAAANYFISFFPKL